MTDKVPLRYAGGNISLADWNLAIDGAVEVLADQFSDKLHGVVQKELEELWTIALKDGKHYVQFAWHWSDAGRAGTAPPDDPLSFEVCLDIVLDEPTQLRFSLVTAVNEYLDGWGNHGYLEDKKLASSIVSGFRELADRIERYI